MNSPYPRWQYARIAGQVVTRKITSPEQEDPEVWKESPADVPPSEPEPVVIEAEPLPDSEPSLEAEAARPKKPSKRSKQT